jgi:hypothetical protein
MWSRHLEGAWARPAVVAYRVAEDLLQNHAPEPDRGHENGAIYCGHMFDVSRVIIQRVDGRYCWHTSKG